MRRPDVPCTATMRGQQEPRMRQSFRREPSLRRPGRWRRSLLIPQLPLALAMIALCHRHHLTVEQAESRNLQDVAGRFHRCGIVEEERHPQEFVAAVDENDIGSDDRFRDRSRTSFGPRLLVNDHLADTFGVYADFEDVSADGIAAVYDDWCVAAEGCFRVVPRGVFAARSNGIGEKADFRRDCKAGSIAEALPCHCKKLGNAFTVEIELPGSQTDHLRTSDQRFKSDFRYY